MGQSVGDAGRDVSPAGNFAERFRPQSAGIIGSSENQLRGKRKENTGNFVDSFIAHSAVDHMDFAACIKTFEVVGESSGTGGVVGAIENDVRIRRNLFEAAGPNGILNSLGRNAKGFECKGGSDRVFDLMFTGEWTFEPGEFGASRSDVQIADFEIAGTLRGNMPVQDGLRFGSLTSENRRDAGLEDAGLFRRDGFDSAAEVSLVIEVDGSDDSEHRIEDVSRIEATSEAGFDDRGFDAHFAKEPEAHGGDGFEISRMRIARHFVNRVEGLLELARTDGHAIDDDAFGGLY